MKSALACVLKFEMRSHLRQRMGHAAPRQLKLRQIMQHADLVPELAMLRAHFSDAIGSSAGAIAMPDMRTVEVKAFVPAKDFDLSKQFYRDLGFDLAWSDDHLAEFRHGDSSFLLQNFYNEVHAGNFMMHLLVEDVDAWWDHVRNRGLPANYGVHSEPPTDRGGMRDFVLVDPTGVLWRVAQNLPKA